jgi:propionyl-CoA synthetase
MKRIAESQAYTAPATIDDPAILDEITHALKGAGYARGKP